MHLVVFEDYGFKNLLPLVYTRPAFKLRCGFDALLHKIETAFDQPVDATLVRASLRDAFHARNERPVIGVDAKTDADDQLWINGRALVTAAFEVPANSVAWHGDTLVAARVNAATAGKLAAALLENKAHTRDALNGLDEANIAHDVAHIVDYPWNLVHANAAEITRQFATVESTHAGRIDDGVYMLNPQAVHVGSGSRLMPCTVLDAENGPIYIDDHVTVRPNVTIAGPCYIGSHCTIQSGANIREGTSLGMWSKVGGEVEETIIHGYSNKQHDGFLGHSYVGEWVNLGADTVTSDLKNTYGNVQVPINGRLVDSGKMFVGSIIGDHTKTGINVALPTGCVIGFASNIFVSNYPPKFVGSFSWLTDEGSQVNDPKRALQVAHKVVARRKRKMSEKEDALFLSIVEQALEFEFAGRD